MLEILVTDTFKELFYELPQKIQNKANKKTDLFKRDPFNRTLHTEKKHTKHNVWCFWVDKHYRIAFKFVGNKQAQFLLIGHHNQIYNYDIFK